MKSVPYRTAALLEALLVASAFWALPAYAADPGTSLLSKIRAAQQQAAQVENKLSQIAGNDDTSAAATTTSAVAPQAARRELSRSLGRGSRGLDVELLQKLLATDATIYPQGFVTGFYGTLTSQAVWTLQNRYGLTADGSVSGATLALVNAILARSEASSTMPADLLAEPESRAFSVVSITENNVTRYTVTATASSSATTSESTGTTTK